VRKFFVSSLVVIALGLGLAIVSPRWAGADSPKFPVYSEMGVLLNDVALNGAESTRTTAAIQTLAYNQIFLYVNYTWSAATDIRVTCRANYDLTDAVNYKYLAWDCATSPICVGQPWSWRVNVTASDAWVIPIPWMGRQITCIASGTGAGAADKITIKGLGGVM
jgi:hypothetical protein